MSHHLTRRNWLTACCGATAAAPTLWLPAGLAGDEPPKADPLVLAADDIPCAELHLPPAQRAEAAKEAQKENPENVPVELPKDGGTAASPLALNDQDADPDTVVSKLGALLKAKKWAKGRVLKVHFLGGTAGMRMKVQQFAGQWSQFANIKFQFGATAAQSDVRIAFANAGHWSYLGTDVLLIAKDKPTMNLQLNDGSALTEWSRVVIHEFGHTLGLIHEHQHPGVTIPWDKPKVYAYYLQTQGWDQAMVDNNLFKTYERSWLQYGAYDRKSIMHYPIAAALLTNPKYAIGWNTVLSTMDKLFIKAAYPA